jgi:flavin reductase (DIM6/NTAB) family NADH-FMN oxidoreductase RutF
MKQAEIAALIRTISTGIYGIGAHHEGDSRIFTASWVMPVSFDPVLVAISINPQNRSYALIQKSQKLSINVIAGDDLPLAEQMSAPGDRLARLAWRAGWGGCPLLDNAIAQLECELVNEIHAGDHQLVVGKVVGGALLKKETPPLLYQDTGTLDGATALFPESL